MFEGFDVFINNQGTIACFAPLTARAKEWFDENVQSESWQWRGNALAVDHRCAADLMGALAEAGMAVTD
jgi:hypothetical protein